MHGRTTNTFKTTILLASLGGLFVVAGSALGGRGGATLGLLLGFGIVGASYWGSDKLAIRSARAVPADEAAMPEYFRIVRELSTRMDMPMPRLYVSPDMQPNAFATGRNPKHAAVAVTRGILEALTWDELRGVLAHELAHVKNRDVLIGSIAAAIATAISYLVNMAWWSSMFGGNDDEGPNPIVAIAAMVVAPLAATILQLAVTRSRELDADRTGAALLGDGEPLARALEKIEHYAHRIPMDVPQAQASLFIVNPLSGRRMQFSNLFRTHPPTEERVARLRAGTWR